MKRRSFLKGLGAAPVAAPIIATQAKEAIMAETTSPSRLKGWMTGLAGSASKMQRSTSPGESGGLINEPVPITVDDFIKAYFKSKQRLRFRSHLRRPTYTSVTSLRDKARSSIRSEEIYNTTSGTTIVRPLKSVKNLEFMVDVVIKDNKDRWAQQKKNSSDSINARDKKALFKKMMLNLMSPEFMLLDEDTKAAILNEFEYTLKEVDDEKDPIFKIGDSFFDGPSSVRDSENSSE